MHPRCVRASNFSKTLRFYNIQHAHHFLFVSRRRPTETQWTEHVGYKHLDARPYLHDLSSPALQSQALFFSGAALGPLSSATKPSTPWPSSRWWPPTATACCGRRPRSSSRSICCRSPVSASPVRCLGRSSRGTSWRNRGSWHWRTSSPASWRLSNHNLNYTSIYILYIWYVFFHSWKVVWVKILFHRVFTLMR